MPKLSTRPLAPDRAERERALDRARSILVQAPAGSGKTDLLTRRFLTLLGEVEDPNQIVAITFTRAAAAEMRHRILAELEKAASADASAPPADEFSMDSLASRALERSRALGWQLPELPAQLRISTIDSFCRELAIQQPLLSGFGNDLRVDERPSELYRRAARRTLKNIDANDATLSAAIEDLLLWRDNGWSEFETLLVEMLGKRDRWMHDFVLQREPDWNALRERLERPFAKAAQDGLTILNALLDRVPGARDEALQLARVACAQSGSVLHQDLAELAEFPAGPCETSESLEETRCAFLCLADLVLTKDQAFRQQVNKNNGFPTDRKAEKTRVLALIADLHAVDGLEDALAAIRSLPPARYTEEDWRIVRACFTLLRRAAAELHAVFAEAGAVDFIEVAQIAQQVLVGEDDLPSDAAIALADGIHHLLVDEFQDTSRRQHRLLASLAAAWPDQAGRTIFVVGDPMQSIYFFRDSDAELFPRVRQFGLEMPESDTLPFAFVPLTANFRTHPALIRDLNDAFEQVFAANDGSGVTFSPSQPARDPGALSLPRLSLHLAFMPQTRRGRSFDPDAAQQKTATDKRREQTHESQIAEIVALIRGHHPQIEQARAREEKYRIAVLGRTRAALAPIAAALREHAIPFRGVELEPLQDRPEVLDALALGRALLNPIDRVAWLGVLRAPWCGLPLDELHILTSADEETLLRLPVPRLIRERIQLLRPQNRRGIERVLHAADWAAKLASSQPTACFGTWLRQVWLSLGGDHCVDKTALTNLTLLWSSLDSLPNGAQDFLGPALPLALESLTAMPDSGASSVCGVQLMTIHKSKGLEFEVVIVPELQAQVGASQVKLLSWLERGLAQPDESGEITEFLVAPLPTKGSESGQTKTWVDRIYSEREAQERRRILYVAATRAREKLHLFARPEYTEDSGGLSLVAPAKSLLATAWPAFEQQVRTRFEQWKSARDREPAEFEEPDAAASAASDLIALSSSPKPTILRRLPAHLEPTVANVSDANLGVPNFVRLADLELYARHEGGTASRALGSAVHKLLEELARLRATHAWAAATNSLAQFVPRIVAQIRAAGIAQAKAHSIADRALEIALQAAHDPVCQWILSPHTGASSESAWTGVIADALRSVRVDRVFRAGLNPLTEGDEAWWIIDYKTAHADDLGPLVALPTLRGLFAPQLEAYAAILRNGENNNLPIHAGLYYPRMTLLDWWAIES
jgi:ATP-dependent helicase/nuclease subunit A